MRVLLHMQENRKILACFWIRRNGRLSLNGRNVYLALEQLDPGVRLVVSFLDVVRTADFGRLRLLDLVEYQLTAPVVVNLTGLIDGDPDDLLVDTIVHHRQAGAQRKRGESAK